MLKGQGTNPYLPVDIALEALIGHATFVARSFAGDPKQVKELIKAALAHRGVAVLDIISPCVTFNNKDESIHSYSWGKEHEVALHELSFVPRLEEIMIEYGEGEITEVTMHDGSRVILKKLEREYNPRDRANALRVLEEANANKWLLTGLLYIDEDQPTLSDIYKLTDTPLNRLQESRIRPGPETMQQVNDLMF